MMREFLTKLVEPRGFERALSILLLLNLFDALFTLFWIEADIASEANPLMAQAFTLGPMGFIVVKLALVTLSVGLIWRLRARRGARVALVPVAVLYAYVVGGHVGYALFLALRDTPALASLWLETPLRSLLG